LLFLAAFLPYSTCFVWMKAAHGFASNWDTLLSNTTHRTHRYRAARRNRPGVGYSLLKVSIATTLSHCRLVGNGLG
jgi:hypothetical protein